MMITMTTIRMTVAGVILTHKTRLPNQRWQRADVNSRFVDISPEMISQRVTADCQSTSHWSTELGYWPTKQSIHALEFVRRISLLIYKLSTQCVLHDICISATKWPLLPDCKSPKRYATKPHVCQYL